MGRLVLEAREKRANLAEAGEDGQDGKALPRLDDELAELERELREKKENNEMGTTLLTTSLVGHNHILRLYTAIMDKITEERQWFVSHVPGSAALLAQ